MIENSAKTDNPHRLRRHLPVFIFFAVLIAAIIYVILFNVVLPGTLFDAEYTVLIAAGTIISSIILTWLRARFIPRNKKYSFNSIFWARRDTIRLCIFAFSAVALLLVYLVIHDSFFQAGYDRDLAAAIKDFEIFKMGEISQNQIKSTLIALERGTSSARETFQDNDAQKHPVYLFPDFKTFQSFTGTKNNVAGLVLSKNGGASIYLPVEQAMKSDQLATTPKHEAVHLVLAEILGENVNNLPRWFNEGIASYEGFKTFGFEELAEKYYERLLLWRKLVPATPEQFLFSTDLSSRDFDEGCYYTSLELIRYLVSTRGEKSLSEIVHNMAAGADFRSSFQKVVGTSPEKLYSQWAGGFY